jgi:predicted glycosyltransferase
MFYGRDAAGLGQLKRTLTLSRYFQARWPAMRQLIVTGCPVPRQLPRLEGVDYLKLPSLQRVGPDELAPRVLPISPDAARELYRDLLLSLAHHFQPDALLVDSVEGEVVPMLRYLKEAARHTRLILGLRDVVAEAPLVRAMWEREGLYDLLDNLFDRILVYGERDIYDVVSEYGLSSRAAEKTRFVGYLRRDVESRTVQQVRAELELGADGLVLVTAGGGEDGRHLFEVMLEVLRRRQGRAARFDSLLVGGPLMPLCHQQTLRSLASTVPGARFVDSVDDLTAYVAAADVVVSMGGHSTICEILSFARPAVIVPRAAPRREQLIRAEALSKRGLVRMIHPDELTPARLSQELEGLLERPVAAAAPVRLDGAAATAAELDSLLAQLPG